MRMTVMILLLCLFASTASAQISRTLAESTMGETVAVETVGGETLEGTIRSASDTSIIFRGNDGQVHELPLARIKSVRVTGPATPAAPAAGTRAPATTTTTAQPAASSTATDASREERLARYRAAQAQGTTQQQVPMRTAADYYRLNADQQRAENRLRTGSTLRTTGIALLTIGGISAISGLTTHAVKTRKADDAITDCFVYDECDNLRFYPPKGIKIFGGVGAGLAAAGLVLVIPGAILSSSGRRDLEHTRTQRALISVSPEFGRRTVGARLRLDF